MKCEYVCGTERVSKHEPGTAKGNMNAISQMRLCGIETKNLIRDSLTGRMVPICTDKDGKENHAMFSLPLWEWK